MTGKKIGHYLILEKIGQGGMGVVYKARDLHLDRFVAVKVLPPGMMAHEERRKRFFQEAKAASALSHPNIVTIYDADRIDEVDFISMEYVQGKTLSTLIGPNGPGLAQALSYAAQIADGASAAHAAKIIHRDLKPTNVMVTESGQVKVLDFGLAKFIEPPPPEPDEPTRSNEGAPAVLTLDGTVMGTVAYMSPEQTEGKKLDVRSDIFSLGTILYEMLTGRRPFRGDSNASIQAAILREEPRPVTSIAATVPREVERLVSRCLRKNPARRLQTMADLKVALDDLREEAESGKLNAPTPAAAPVAAPAVVVAQPRRWPWIALAACGFVAAGVGVWYANRPVPVPQESTIRQVTRDSGLTNQPALSPDGKLLAYVSDRVDGQNRDIWVQQMAGGQPMRLTRNPTEDTNPQFSPDGTTIYFLSSRPEGTVWSVPTLGGDERIITKELVSSLVVSPDGQWLAAQSPAYVGQSAPALLLSTSAGSLRKVVTSIQTFYPEAWSADSRTLVGWGKDSPRSIDGDEVLYGVPANGGQAIPIPVDGKAIRRRGAIRLIGNRLFLSGGGLIEEHNLSNSWSLGGPTRRWAQFPGANLEFAVSDRTLVVASVTATTDLWSVPIEANRGRVLGQPERLTHDEARDWSPSLSADGRRMIYTSDRHGNRDVWLREMATGKETQVTATAETETRGRISPDGERVAYEVDGQPRSIFVRAIGGGEPQLACRTCNNPGWTPDSARVVYWDGNPVRYNTFHVVTGERTKLVSHATASIQNARFSPDGQWISFHLPLGTSRTQIWIAPVRKAEAAPQSEWVLVEDRAAYAHCWWSPDGRLLYSIGQDRASVYAWALDPVSKRPRGESFHVFAAAPGLRFSFTNVVGLSVVPDRMVLSMVQFKSNLWRID